MPEINLGLQDLVDKAKSSFHSWALALVMSSLIASEPWIATPVLRQIIQLIVSRILTIMINEGELGAFIVNTKVLTSAQAADYREAAARVLTTPGTDIEAWKKAEEDANLAFDKLIRFTS